MNKRHSIWTKDQIKYLVANWDTMTKEQLAAAVDKSGTSVNIMARRLRVAGVKLARKDYKGGQTMQKLVAEVVAELGVGMNTR